MTPEAWEACGGAGGLHFWRLEAIRSELDKENGFSYTPSGDLSAWVKTPLPSDEGDFQRFLWEWPFPWHEGIR